MIQLSQEKRRRQKPAVFVNLNVIEHLLKRSRSGGRYSKRKLKKRGRRMQGVV